MNIPSLEFYVESIRHLTSSIAVRRPHIEWLDHHLKNMKRESVAVWRKEFTSQTVDYYQLCKKEIKDTKKLLENVHAKQKHEKRMLAYFVAQQRDILDYYKATEELYEETL